MSSGWAVRSRPLPGVGRARTLNPVGDADDVSDDPVGGLVDLGEAAVQHHVVAVGDDQLVFVTQFGRQRLDEVEQAVAPGFDMCAVLDVVR